MLTVRTVIACYTEKRWTATLRAIESARTQTYPNELVVVVDHNDGLLARLRAELPPEVQVMPNRYGQGAGGSRNTGALHATTDLLAFLDDDAVAAPTWIESMVLALNAEPKAVGAGGTIVPAWETRRPQWFPEEFSWVVGGTFRPGSEPIPVRNVWSGSMIVKTAPFVAAAGFRDGFGKMGGAAQPEDTELCLRISHRGSGGWLFVPESIIEHAAPAERATWSYFVRRCWAEGKGKALLADLSPQGVAVLDEEAAFARRAMLRGVGRNLAAAARADLARGGRAAAILVGLGAAAVAFAQTSAVLQWRKRRGPLNPPGRPRTGLAEQTPSPTRASRAEPLAPAVANPDSQESAKTSAQPAILPVLMYHGVPKDGSGAHDPLDVPMAQLREHVQALQADGWTLLGLSEALDTLDESPTAKVVAITFDDGLLDFHNAADVLDELGARATLYVPSGLMEDETSDAVGSARPRSVLSWRELAGLAQRGIEIGSHSHNHRALDVLAPHLLPREVLGSRTDIEDRLGAPVRSFSYPYGYHSPRVREAVAAAGYDNACVVGRRLADGRGDRFAIPRLQVRPDSTGSDVGRLVVRGEPGPAPAIKRVLYPAWRVVRLGSSRLLDKELT